MIRNEAVDKIKEVLGFRKTLDATIISNLILAQTQLELGPIKPWWMVSEDATARTRIDERRVKIPDDFLEEVDSDALVYIPENGNDNEVELVKEELDKLRKEYGNASGAPEAYALLGSYFRIFPTPDEKYLLRMIYYKRDTSLSSNVENGWLKWNPYILMGEAGLITARSLRETSGHAIEQFREWKSSGMLLLNSQQNAREMSNRSLQIGGPH